MKRILIGAALLGAAAAACGDAVIVDDYRRSSVVVRGTVSDAAGRRVARAAVELAPVRPPYLHGDTVSTGEQGAFVAVLETMGVGTFHADVQVRARGPGGATADTLLTGIRVVEERPLGRQPDTVTLALRLPAP